MGMFSAWMDDMYILYATILSLSPLLTLLALMKTKDTCMWWSSFRGGGRIENESNNNGNAWKVVAICGLLSEWRKIWFHLYQ